MEVTAKVSFARSSAQKTRLVADLIRGQQVESALSTLRFCRKKAADIVLKVVESAVANAENNEGADIDTLRVGAIYVDEGPSLKRMMPRAKGRANRIVKRTCHVVVKLTDK